jgi:arabinose-5-phosphate isomerase
MDHIATAREVMDIELEALRKVRDGLDGSFDRAIGILLHSLDGGGKIVVTGLGKSLHVGQKIAATLTSTGSTAVVLHPSEALHGDLGILNSHDVVLAISYSGASDELTTLLPLIKHHHTPIIALTGDPESPLATNSDEVISIQVEREACPLNISPTASTTATLAVGDAVAMALLRARGFSREDYAKLHPGGAIGRALLLKIKDIMRTGKRVAHVTADRRVSDAVFAMTEARAGSVVVLDEDYRVLGIFTDGDLRRGLTQREKLMDTPIDSVMTQKPITLKEDQLAVDVLAHFREHQIDDLIIVDQRDRFVGMVDLQDLPKFKLI